MPFGICWVVCVVTAAVCMGAVVTTVVWGVPGGGGGGAVTRWESGSEAQPARRMSEPQRRVEMVFMRKPRTGELAIGCRTKC